MGLFDILLQLRAHKTGLVSDVQKPFLNIAVDEGQRNLMRFLWTDDINKQDPAVESYL